MRWIVLLVVAASLAGCSQETTTGTCESLAPGEPCVEYSLTDGKGVLRGVVVDEAIVPVPGVLVTPGPGQQATTEEGGLFVLQDLDPGFYNLRFSKLGFYDTEVQAVVEANQVSPILKVQMKHIPGFDPFYNQFQWEGYLQCNTIYANVCFIVNYYPNFVTGTGYILPDDSLHQWYEEFVDVGRHPHLTQIETVWESTQPLGEKLSIRYETGDIRETFLLQCVFGSLESASPQTFRINLTRAQDAGLGAEDPYPDPDNDEDGRCDAEKPWGLIMEFFSGDALGICQPQPVIGCQPRFGATLEQRTTTFVHAFYDYVPPEDWTFVETSDVPPP